MMDHRNYHMRNIMDVVATVFMTHGVAIPSHRKGKALLLGWDGISILRDWSPW
jgi:hypothetical protein